MRTLPRWIVVAATATNVALAAYTWWESRTIVGRITSACVEARRACAEASVGWRTVEPSEVRAAPIRGMTLEPQRIKATVIPDDITDSMDITRWWLNLHAEEAARGEMSLCDGSWVDGPRCPPGTRKWR